MSKKNVDVSLLLKDAALICRDIITVTRMVSDIVDKAIPLLEALAPLFDEPKAVKLSKVADAEEVEALPEYSKEDVRKKLAGLAETKRNEVKSLLTKYGAGSLSELSPEHYAAIMADAEELNNG